MDDKLSAKTAKITSLENLYVYGILTQPIITYGSLANMAPGF